jgi:3,2-trans-enoyl-CoA isomerase
MSVLKSIKVHQKGNYAMFVLNRAPVNSLDLEMYDEMTMALSSLETDPNIRGIIIHSGIAKQLFSAGNDVNELCVPRSSLDRYTRFWKVSNTFFSRLLVTPLVTIAAIKGYCPAGGCMLSMCCDYRVMTSDGKIGLNEVQLGIPVPFIWTKVMQYTIGTGRTDKLVQFALMPNATQALEMGLVDELAGDEQELLQKAHSTMQNLIKVSKEARTATKLLLRSTLANELGNAERLEREAISGWKMLSDPKIISYLEKIKPRL